MAEVQVNSSEQSDSNGELILGKFGSQADLEKAYTELQKKLGQGNAQGSLQQTVTDDAGNVISDSTQPPAAESQKTADPSVTPQDTETYGEAITTAATAAGLDLSAINAEFQSETGISEKSLESLYAVYGKGATDAYLAGVTAQQSGVTQQAIDATNSVYEAVGGEQAWNTIQTWAGGPNADATLTDTFNDAVESGNTGVMRATALAMKATYEAREGSLSSQSLTSGAPVGSEGASGFRSQSELTNAMRDPRYKTDGAYRDDVARRLAKSDGFTVS